MSQTKFLFKVEHTLKDGTTKTIFADVLADLDENARRRIIHDVFSEGGSVKKIFPVSRTKKLQGKRRRFH